MNIELETAIGDVLVQASRLSPTSAAHVTPLLQAIARLRVVSGLGSPPPVYQTHTEAVERMKQSQSNAYVPQQAPDFYAASTQYLAPQAEAAPDVFRSGGGGDFANAGASGSWESSPSSSSESSSSDSSSSSSDSGSCSSSD